LQTPMIFQKQQNLLPITLVSTSDQEIDVKDRNGVAACPLNTLRSLQYQGLRMAASELPPPDHEFYSATGRKLYMNATLKQDLSTFFLLSQKSINRQNLAGQVMLDAAFDMSSYTRLSNVFPYDHVLQLLLILLANKVYNMKIDLVQVIATLGNCAFTTTADLKTFISTIETAGILDNILKHE
jgi:hypothetical protein